MLQRLPKALRLSWINDASATIYARVLVAGRFVAEVSSVTCWTDTGLEAVSVKLARTTVSAGDCAGLIAIIAAELGKTGAAEKQ